MSDIISTKDQLLVAMSIYIQKCQELEKAFVDGKNELNAIYQRRIDEILKDADKSETIN